MFRIALLAILAAALHAQSFEAASIKLGDPASPETSWNSSPGLLRIQGMTLKRLVMSAYDVKEYQVAGGPKWVDGVRYDITAKLTPAQQDIKDSKKRSMQMRAALQALLAERFQLQIHEETKIGPGYALVVGKSGLRIQPMDNGGNSSTSSGHGRMTAKGVSMQGIADHLSAELRLPVVDRTAVEGAYEFRLTWTPETESDNPSPDRPAGPSIFTALQETLGLKLEAVKLPMKVLVIDRAEKPDEN